MSPSTAMANEQATFRTRSGGDLVQGTYTGEEPLEASVMGCANIIANLQALDSVDTALVAKWQALYDKLRN